MGQEEGRGQGLGQEVRSEFRRRHVGKNHDSIRDKSADVVVADVDVAGLPGDLGGLGQLDGRSVVLKNGGGVLLRKAIGVEEVPEEGGPAATAGEADILGLHARQGDTRVLSRGRA